MSDLRKTFGDDWDIWIGAFGRGSTNGLIRAAGAGISLTCLFGLGAWTMFCSVLAVSLETIAQRHTWFGSHQIRRHL